MHRPFRVATLEECARYGSRGGHKALRARGLLPPIMGGAGWSNSLTDSFETTAAGTAGVSLAFGSNVTAGQVIVAGALYIVGGALTATFSDTSGNVTAWNTGGAHAETVPAGVNYAIGWGIATSTGACTPKVTFNSATSATLDIWIGSFTAPAGTVSQDGADTRTTGTAATIITPAAGGAGANDLVINLAVVANIVTGVAGGWVLMGPVPLSGNATSYLLNAAGNSTPNASQSSGTFASLMMALKSTSAAAPAVFPVFLPRNTTGRGVRAPRPMRLYARTPPPPPLAGATFIDSATGALIFGGTVQDGWTWAFPRQSHARRLPIARGLRDPAGLRGYTRTPVALRYTYTDTATGAWIFGGPAVEAKRGTDAGSGAWIFAGSRVEAKRGTDARSGAIIFGGSRTEAITFVQARSGSVIFGGARTELKRGTDAQAGSVIFGGLRTELKRYGDVRSGTVTFGGSATQLRVGTDARTGTIIFGGHSSTAVTTTARVKVTYIVPDARGRRRRTRQ